MTLQSWIDDYLTVWLLLCFGFLLVLFFILIKPRKKSKDFLDTDQGREFSHKLSKIDLNLDSSESRD